MKLANTNKQAKLSKIIIGKSNVEIALSKFVTPFDLVQKLLINKIMKIGIKLLIQRDRIFRIAGNLYFFAYKNNLMYMFTNLI